jgi:antitoxin component YwqK of YwqJK toxin-antitoxin module
MRILILFICSLLFSCSLFETTKRSFELNTEGNIFKYKGELYTGLVLDESKTGRVITSFRCINGKIEGEYLNYYSDGKLRIKESYINGKEEGKHLHYYPFGELYFKSHYKKGELHGSLIQFNKNNEIVRLENYINGKKNGYFLKKDFYANIEIGNYKNDLLNGFWKCKNKDGIIIAKGKLKNGNEEIRSRSDFPNDGRIGKWYFYYDEGTLQATHLYRSNSNIVDIKGYYPSGQLSGKGTYDKETLDYITWKSYN